MHVHSKKNDLIPEGKYKIALWSFLHIDESNACIKNNNKEMSG